MSDIIKSANGTESREWPATSGGIPQTSLGDGIRRANDNLYAYPKSTYTNLSASASVATGAGEVVGIVINSHTSGTVKLWDNTAGSGTVICETISFAVGERWIPLFGMTFGTGLYATIGGTANITIAYNTADV